MIKKFFLTLILICATVLTFAQGTINIYVSPDGTGDGTTAATPTTLTAALAQIEAATVSEATNYKINLADGTYAGDAVPIHQQLNKNITIEAQSSSAIMGHDLVIFGGNRTGTETLVLKGLIFDGAILRCASGTEEAHTYIHNVTVDGCDFQNGTNWAINFGPLKVAIMTSSSVTVRLAIILLVFLTLCRPIFLLRIARLPTRRVLPI